MPPLIPDKKTNITEGRTRVVLIDDVSIFSGPLMPSV